MRAERLVNRRVLNGVLVLTGVLVLNLCCEKEPATAPVEKPDRHLVLIRDHYFSPQGITVALGDTVEWLNIGLIPHFTTSAAAPCSSSGLWSFRLWNGESGTIVLGEGALDTTGILSYYCDNHCNRAMTGTILVEP